MCKWLAVAWAVAAFCLPAFTQAQSKTALIISIREGDSSWAIRFDGDTVSGDLEHFGSELKSTRTVRLGERIEIPGPNDAFSTTIFSYGGFFKQGHTLIYTQKDSINFRNAYGKFVRRTDGSFTKSIDIKDDGTCVLSNRIGNAFYPEDETYQNYDKPSDYPGPVACSWVPERTPGASVRSSGISRTCEGGVSTSERQTSSTFCITIYNQCGFSIMARLSRTDHKNGGSFQVGANPTTVCSDDLSWKYELDSYLPRPGG